MTPYGRHSVAVSKIIGLLLTGNHADYVLCVPPLLHFAVHTFALILIQNNLPDRSIIQLYSKSTQSYLCIEESGAVKESVDEKLSKFIKHLICMYTTHQWNIIMLQNLYTQRICYTVTEEWGLYLWMPTRDQDTD